MTIVKAKQIKHFSHCFLHEHTSFLVPVSSINTLSNRFLRSICPSEPPYAASWPRPWSKYKARTGSYSNQCYDSEVSNSFLFCPNWSIPDKEHPNRKNERKYIQASPSLVPMLSSMLIRYPRSASTIVHGASSRSKLNQKLLEIIKSMDHDTWLSVKIFLKPPA